MKAFLNGELAPLDQLRIDPTDRGFTLGDGVFETMLVRGGRPVGLGDHLARMRAGLDALGFGGAPARGVLERACLGVVEANGLDAAVIRLTVTRGAGVRGLAPPAEISPTVLAVAAPYAPPPPEVAAIIAQGPTRNERSPLARFKTLAYQDNILALMEAKAAGADEAILLNTQGRVVCSSVANIFVRRGDAIITPPLAEGPLGGTVRAALLRALDAAEEPIPLDALSTCDEIILTNSLSVRRVARLGGAATPAETRLFETARRLHDALA